MGFLDQAKSKYSGFDASGKLITIIAITSLTAYIISFTSPFLFRQLVLPSGFIRPLLQPWSYITHAFIHNSFLHFFSIAIGLYLSGQFFLNLYTGRQYLTLFFIGVLGGAISYTASTSLLDFYFTGGTNLGASAGVYSLVFFCTTYFAERDIRILFFNLKLKYIAYILLALAVIGLFNSAFAGSSLAHLTGMAIGYYTAIRMREGIDVLEGFAKVGDYFANFFKKSDRPKQRPAKKKAKMKTVYKNTTKTQSKTQTTSGPSQSEIDRILDKISESGYESLSKKEKDALFNAGKK